MLKYDSNGNFKVFLIDFGLSSYINGGEYTASSLKGTDKYIDPILVIDSELSQYADLWALGVMILTRLAP